VWAEGEEEGEDGEGVAKVHPAPRRTSKTEGSMDVLQCGGDYGRTGKREEGRGRKGRVGWERKIISWSEVGRGTLNMEAR